PRVWGRIGCWLGGTKAPGSPPADGASGKNQISRAFLADNRRQHHCGNRRKTSQRDLGKSPGCRFAGVNNVAQCRELSASAQTASAYGCDGHLLEIRYRAKGG